MEKTTWKEAIYETTNDWAIKLLFLLSIISIIIGIFENGINVTANLAEHFAPLIGSIAVFLIAIYTYKRMPLDNPQSRKIVEYNKRLELESLVLTQINNGEKMSEKVIKALIETFAVSEVEGSIHHLTQTVITTIRIQNCSFVIVWEKGIYDKNDNKYDFQPIKA